MFKRTIWLTICISLIMLLGFIGRTYAEVVVLKSGKRIEGKIIERSSDHIKVDFYGTTLTYYLDEIEGVEGENFSVAAEGEYKVFCDKGALFLKQGLYNDALAQFEQAVKINSDNPCAYNNIGVVYASKGDYAKAIEELKKAQEHELSDYSKIIDWNLANVYCTAGLLDEAVELSNKLGDFGLISTLSVAIQLKQKNAKVFYTVAASSFPPDTVAFAPLPSSLKKEMIEQIRQKQDQEMQATQDKTYIVENFPLLFLYHSPLSYLNLAQYYIGQKDPERAKQYLDRAQKNIENMQDYLDRIALTGIYFFRGKIDLDEDKYAQAQGNFQKASELFPKWHILHTFIGVAYYLQANYNDAGDEFKIALKYVVPGSQQAKEIEMYLKEIEKKQDQPKKNN